MTGEVGLEGLEHHPLAHGDLPQLGELVWVKSPGIGVGEEPGLFRDELTATRQVVDGRGKAVGLEPFGRDGIAQLGAFPEGEESLVTAGPCAGLGDGEHLGGGEIGLGDPGRRLREGAVATTIPAKHCEGDEHLGRESHPDAVAAVADVARSFHQLCERHGEDLGVAEEDIVPRAGPAGGGGGVFRHRLTLGQQTRSRARHGRTAKAPSPPLRASPAGRHGSAPSSSPRACRLPRR